jgi:hypothetical protein
VFSVGLPRGYITRRIEGFSKERERESVVIDDGEVMARKELSCGKNFVLKLQ